jgi:hypothetical protein
MRGMVVVTALGLIAVAAASSSYLAISKVQEGRTDVCEVKSDPFEADANPAAMIHRVQNSMKRRSKKGTAER